MYAPRPPTAETPGAVDFRPKGTQPLSSPTAASVGVASSGSVDAGPDPGAVLASALRPLGKPRRCAPWPYLGPMDAPSMALRPVCRAATGSAHAAAWDRHGGHRELTARSATTLSASDSGLRFLSLQQCTFWPELNNLEVLGCHAKPLGQRRFLVTQAGCNRLQEWAAPYPFDGLGGRRSRRTSTSNELTKYPQCVMCQDIGTSRTHERGWSSCLAAPATASLRS